MVHLLHYYVVKISNLNVKQLFKACLTTVKQIVLLFRDFFKLL